MASDMKKKIWRLFQCTGTDGSTSDKASNGVSKRIIFKGSYENFLWNGGLLLEERISLFDGKTNPVRCLSVDDLNTSFEDWICLFPGDYSGDWYSCVWEGRPVSVKLCPEDRMVGQETHVANRTLREYCREIVIATQMGIHKNVHKLLACCLETEYPVLIYESVKVCSLPSRICGENKNEPPLEWKDRLRISWEISHAVAYLHKAFPRVIVHRDLKPDNVFLDQHNAAKLAGFYWSVLIPKGKTFLEADVIAGTLGYVAPEAYLGNVTEKSDVYSFGVLLLELVTGLTSRGWRERLKDYEYPGSDGYFGELGSLKMKEFIKDNIDTVVSGSTGYTEATSEEGDLFRQQLRALIVIGLRCMEQRCQNRPTMVEVASELKNMVVSYASSTGTMSSST